MELGSKISEWNDSLMQFLNGQEWYQQIQEKWNELDLQTRTALKLGMIILAALALLFIALSWGWRVHSLRSELLEKRELLSFIQSSSSEMNQLKESAALLSRNSGPTDRDTGGGWQSYFESIALSAGVEKANLSIANEKVGTSSDQAKETLMDLVVKKANVKQLTHFGFGLENGAKPVKIRNMTVDSKNDPSGFLEATFAVSAFTLLPPK